MTSLYVRKPRNVRSVYARPRPGRSEGSECGEGREASVVRPQPSRPRQRGGKAGQVNRTDQKPPSADGTTEAPSREGRRWGQKWRKEGGDGSCSTAQSSVAKGSFTCTKVGARKAGCPESPVSNESALTNSSAREAGRAARPKRSVSKQPSVNKSDKDTVHKPPFASVKNAHRASVSTKTDTGSELTAQSQSPVSTEPLVSARTLTLLKHKISESRQAVADPPTPADNNISSQSITTLKPYVCSVCQRRYRSEGGLRHHQHLHQQQEGGGGERGGQRMEAGAQFQCQVCSKVFGSKSTLARHQPVHSPVKPFVCDVCGHSFSQAAHLRAHMLHHTGERPFVCEVCSKTYLNNFDLQQHKRIHTGERPFVCNTCGKAFMKMEYLKIHKQVHSDVKPYKCDQCSKTFRRSSQLKAHKSTHTGIKSFECDTCSKRFSTKAVLKKHMHIHARKKDHAQSGSRRMPYICDVCGAEIGKKSSFKIHMMTHTGERPHVCEVCNRGYITKNELVIHRRSHTGERPFVCHVCSATFPRNSDLRRHVNTIHWGKKPHACEVCQKAFSDRRTLKEHRFTHLGIRPHKCSQCGKCFTQAGSLKSHVRTHTGEKPFACKYCSKRFTDIGGRNRHVRIHTGEKPYECTLCGAVFARSEPYKHHRETVHGDSVAKATMSVEQSTADADQASPLSQVVQTEQVSCRTAQPSGDMSYQLVTTAPPPRVLHLHTSQPLCQVHPSPAMVVHTTEMHDGTLSSSAQDISSVAAVGGSSGDCSCRGVEGFSSVKEDGVHAVEARVIYQPLPSSYTVSQSCSGSEVIEYTIVEHHGHSVSGFSHGEGATSSAVVVELEDHALPRLVEVQVSHRREGGLAPRVCEVKLDDSGRSAVCGVEPETEDAEHCPASPPEDAEGGDMNTACAAEEVGSELPGLETRAVAMPQAGCGHTVQATSSAVSVVHPGQDTTSAASSAVTEAQAVICRVNNPPAPYPGQPQDSLQSPPANRALAVHHGPQTATPGDLFSAPGEGHLCREGSLNTARSSGLAVVQTQASPKDAVRTTVLPVSKAPTGTCPGDGATTACEPYSAPPCPPDYVHVYHSDGTGSLAVIQPETVVNNDLPKSLLDQIQAHHMGDTSGARIVSLEAVDTIEVISEVSDDVMKNDCMTLADEKPVLESLDLKPEVPAPTGGNYNTNRRFNKKHQPTTMKMDASVFGDILKTRQRTRGKGRKEWMCDVCGKGFSHCVSLKNHVAVQHKRGEGPGFSCDICHKACYSRTVLAAHRRRHTGERPFACEHCSNTYKHKSDLRQHILAAHMGRRPHMCDVCQKTFTERHSLRDHKLIHQGVKPHKCSMCGKAFTQSSSLKTHLRIHTGDRPWVCQYCGKDFSDQSAFTRHQRIHTGEKPFQCEHCPCAFARSDQLKKHVSKDHPGNLQNLATLAAVASMK